MQVIGNALSLLGLYIIYAVMNDPGHRIDGLNWGKIATNGTLGLIIGAIGMWLTTLALKSKQTQSDRASRAAFVAADKEMFSRCALFLRPFDISGKFQLKRRSSPIDLDSLTRPGADALERFLAESFESTAKLVGLGGRGDVEFGLSGAGLVENWQERIEAAMSGAAYILIVPASNPGTLWEVGQIKSRGYFAKTVFIMPPSVYPFEFVGAKHYAQQWNEACVACEEAHGLQLPPYDENGQLFQFDAPSLTRRAVPFSTASPRSLARSINALFS